MFIKNISKDSRITIMLMTATATFITELISYILQVIIFKMPVEIIPFIKIIAVEILFNTMIIIIIYPIIHKLGTILEKVFTESKILTKYY